MGAQDSATPPAGSDQDDRAAAVAAIQQHDSKWIVLDSSLALNEKTNWKPDLRQSDRLLHLSLTGDLPAAWLRRMSAAVDSGLKVTFATTATMLDLEVLASLQELDAPIFTVNVEATPPRVTEHRSVADLVADERYFLDPGSLRTLARARLQQALTTTENHKKGRWFEEVLCLIFSQVSWLTVDYHAYNNETEEIDLVMGCRAVAGYVTGLVGGPIIIATAKNENKATNSQTVKYLKEQVANRKGRCKLGFLCSASSISDDARGEILRGSQSGEIVIPCVDREVLEHLIERADELDSEIEGLISKAIAD